MIELSGIMRTFNEKITSLNTKLDTLVAEMKTKSTEGQVNAVLGDVYNFEVKNSDCKSL